MSMGIAADLWAEFGDKFDAIRRSRSARDSFENATYSVADTFVRPVFMLALSPYLVHKLGLDLFGIWMLANAVSGTYGVFNFGLSDATMKYVSAYLGRNDIYGAVRIIRASFSLTCVIGAILATAVIGFSSLLVHSAFKIAPEQQLLATRALRIAGLLLALRAIESVLTATIRAYERYDVAARITVICKVSALVLAFIAAAGGYRVLTILGAAVATTLASIFALAVAAKKLQPELSLAATVDQRSWREMAHFGGYTWLQSTSAVVFDQMDRLLIGVFVGTSAVAYYAICLQIAQPIHMLSAAAFNCVFPFFSKRRESSKHDLYSPFRVALVASLLLSAATTIPVVVLSRSILRIWMGPAVAAHSYFVLAILAAAFGGLAINVVPHYTLLGMGRVRLVSIVNICCGILALAAMCIAVPKFELVGAAACRLLYAVLLAGPYVITARTAVLHFKSEHQGANLEWA